MAQSKYSKYSSTWQRHKDKACSPSDNCFYCKDEKNPFLQRQYQKVAHKKTYISKLRFS